MNIMRVDVDYLLSTKRLLMRERMMEVQSRSAPLTAGQNAVDCSVSLCSRNASSLHRQ